MVECTSDKWNLPFGAELLLYKEDKKRSSSEQLINIPIVCLEKEVWHASNCNEIIHHCFVNKSSKCYKKRSGGFHSEAHRIWTGFQKNSQNLGGLCISAVWKGIAPAPSGTWRGILRASVSIMVY